MAQKTPLTYAAAGVDIDAGDALVDDIKKIVKSTRRPEVLAGVGGFGALVGLPKKYKKPVLVSGTDGVGTKLRLGIDTGRVQGLGIDLVAMCVNDVLVNGAEPLFFLDYYATGKLDKKVAAQVIKGIANGCKQAGCALVGGETAEMPGMYHDGDFDLAGFCVAVAEQGKLIDGSKIKPGDVMVALPSSGPHSNGYSLIRKILAVNHYKLAPKSELADALLAPTQIYVKPVLKLIESGVTVKGMAHITGGGITENLPRILPKGTAAQIELGSWPVLPIFEHLRELGQVSQDEMMRTFNMGVGLIAAVPAAKFTRAKNLLARAEEKFHVIGRVVKGEQRRVQYT